MGIALDGIGGFPTEQIVTKLMMLERRPGYMLKQKKQAVDASTKAFQGLNSQLKSLTSAAWGIFGKKDKFDKTSDPMAIWGAVKGSSNNKGVSVDTETGAKVGELQFDIVSKAAAKREVFSEDTLKKFTSEMGSDGFSILIGNKITHIKPDSGSMEDMAKAINAVKDVGVSATVVKLRGQDGTEQKMLQIVGKETGEKEGNFQIYKGDVAKFAKLDNDKVKHDAASKSVVYTFADHDKAAGYVGNREGIKGEEGYGRKAADAHIQMYGRDYFYSSNKLKLMDKVTIDISGVEQEKDSNGKNVQGEVPKFPDPLKETNENTYAHGTLTANKPEAVVTKEPKDFVAKGIKVTLSESQDEVAKKVDSMVNALNKVLGTLNQGMKSVEKIRREEDGTETKWKAPGVMSNSIGRQVQSQLGAVLSEGITIKDAQGKTQTYSLQDLGIELKLEGDAKEMSVSFDSSKFKTLMEKNPETARKLATALGEKVGNIGSQFSDATEGMLTKAIDSRKNESEYYDRRINDFEARMKAKEENMKKQYSRLQTALAAYGQKQAWLQGQLAQLNNNMMGGGR